MTHDKPTKTPQCAACGRDMMLGCVVTECNGFHISVCINHDCEERGKTVEMPWSLTLELEAEAATCYRLKIYEVHDDV